MASVPSYYTRSSQFCSLFNDGLENTSKLLKLVESGGRIGLYTFELLGKSHPGLAETTQVFDAAGAALSSVRTLVTLERIFTGKFLFKQKPSGQFLKAKVENAAYVKKNGTYVEDPNGTLALRDWCDIALDIALAIGRVFGTIAYFAKLKLYDLGKHANWIGQVVLGAYTIVVSLSTVQSIVSCIQASNEEVRKKIADCVCTILDALSFPWDAGMGFNTHPILSLVGAGLSAAAAGGYLLKEWIYFNSDV